MVNAVTFFVAPMLKKVTKPTVARGNISRPHQYLTNSWQSDFSRDFQEIQNQIAAAIRVIKITTKESFINVVLSQPFIAVLFTPSIGITPFWNNKTKPTQMINEIMSVAKIFSTALIIF
jgi:hypothetical protein